jgi:hypothetical protein
VPDSGEERLLGGRTISDEPGGPSQGNGVEQSSQRIMRRSVRFTDETNLTPVFLRELVSCSIRYRKNRKQRYNFDSGLFLIRVAQRADFIHNRYEWSEARRNTQFAQCRLHDIIRAKDDLHCLEVFTNVRPAAYGTRFSQMFRDGIPTPHLTP